MVGLRVFDLGALVVWLVWFYRQKDQDEDGRGEDWRREDDATPEEPKPPTGTGGLELPRPDAVPAPKRRRDHTGDRAPATTPARRVPARTAPARRVPVRHGARTPRRAPVRREPSRRR